MTKRKLNVQEDLAAQTRVYHLEMGRQGRRKRRYQRTNEGGIEEGSSDKLVADAYRSAAPEVGLFNDLDEMD